MDVEERIAVRAAPRRASLEDVDIDVEELGDVPHYFMRYIVPPLSTPPSLHYVLVYGNMYSGKTYGVGSILRGLRDMGLAYTYIKAYSVIDVLTLFFAFPTLDVEQRLMIFIDDALLMGHSRSALKEVTDAAFAMFRHAVHRLIGYKVRAITVFVATQKLSITHPLLRSAPVWLLTTSPVDGTDYRILKERMRYIRGAKQIIAALNRLSAYKDIERYKEYYAVITRVAFGLLEVHGPPEPPDIEMKPPDLANTDAYIANARNVLTAVQNVRQIDD